MTLKAMLTMFDALDRGPRRYSQERDAELRDRLRREHQDEGREDRRPWNEAEADRVGIPAYGPID